jgi:hypothetical protein
VVGVPCRGVPHFNIREDNMGCLKISEKELLIIRLAEIGQKIEEFNENPEDYTVAYAEKLEVERIGLLNQYFRKNYGNKVTHIDARRFKTGKL